VRGFAALLFLDWEGSNITGYRYINKMQPKAAFSNFSNRVDSQTL
jgi:hypothetical protein